MLIGGLLKFSLIDYPGKVAAVIFTQGCNYRCPFCHNPELVLPELFTPPIDTGEVMAFLEKRRGQLQGVVITGGEPALQPDLKDVIRRIKDMGFLVKLDTNGSRPDVLREILAQGLVDFVAMDIKAPLADYNRTTGVAADTGCVQDSIALIRSSKVAHLFRTTAVKGFLGAQDMPAVKALLGSWERYKLQRGNVEGKVLDPSLRDRAGEFTNDEWQKLQEACS